MNASRPDSFRRRRHRDGRDMRTSATSQALSNLRGYVILIVLGFHAILAYLGSLPGTVQPFDQPPYEWLAFPIIDNQRWVGFDLFCAWHDVYLMSLMFFLSGLFVWPSLTRKGNGTFLVDRLLRLGCRSSLSSICSCPSHSIRPTASGRPIRASPIIGGNGWRCRPGLAGRSGSCGSSLH
ncbi:MAG: hypothetical protein ACRECO_20740 [Xanthobacteraceae bacterium]